MSKSNPRSPRCHLRKRSSKFVDIFRTTPPKTVCPNFYVLAHASGCLFQPQCSYCYLKSSYWFLKGHEAFTNTDKMIRQIRAWIAKDNLETYMLNTGNLSDSLSFEKARPLITKLVEVFREHAKGRRHTLLLVTKGGTKECAPLLEVAPCKNVVVSFSVNNPEAARQHEKGAATVEDRFRAAALLRKRGWRVRMRLDPMILGYDYTNVIRRLKRFKPERVTLGTLRAEATLPRYTEKGLFRELERPADPKAMARYPFETRLAMYRPAVEALRGVCSVGFCEETPDMWDALGVDKSGKSCNCCA